MKITETSSKYPDLDKMSLRQILEGINAEDRSVPAVVGECIPAIEALVSQMVERMQKGGRVFYIGAGTSGRLGVVDSSEIPPTYGAPYDLFIGVIAGGDGAIRKAVEGAEDDADGAWRDLARYNPNELDILIGIAASGSTPYVAGGLKAARGAGLLTGCICCNPDSLVASLSEFPIVAVVGPEFVTGSTRMKAGTAQKLILNMISTSVMIRLGHVRGNKMIDMKLSNSKLMERGVNMVMQETHMKDEALIRRLLIEMGSVRDVIDYLNEGR